MATTDTNLPQIIFNELSQEKYDELKAAGQLNENEFYITPDASANKYVTVDTEQTITAEKTFEGGIKADTITPATSGSLSVNSVKVDSTDTYSYHTESSLIDVYTFPYGGVAAIDIKTQSINNNTSKWDGAAISIGTSLPSIELMVGRELDVGTGAGSQLTDNGLKIETTLQGAISAKLVGDKINDIPEDSNDGTLVTTEFLNKKLENISAATITYWN